VTKEYLTSFKDGNYFIRRLSDDEIIGIQDISGKKNYFIESIFLKDDKTGEFLGLGNPQTGNSYLFILNKIRASIAAAQNDSPLNKPPLAPAPVWAINTVYQGGQIVRGAAGGSTSNLYFMAGNNTTVNAAGTSAGSGGPTGTGSALITDGTCRWIYFGQATSTGTTPLMSTATITDLNSLMNGYVQFISGATRSAIGLVSYRPTSSGLTYDKEVTYTGGIFGLRSASQLSQPNTGTSAVPVYNVPAKNVIRFKTNSRKWMALAGNAAQPLNAFYRIEINGRVLGESQAASQGAGQDTMLLNLSLFPDGVKTISIYFHGNSENRLAYEFYLEPDAVVWPAENANSWKLAVEGDSITNGSYFAGAGVTDMWFERLLGQELGAHEFYNNAVGGTGILNTNGGTVTTYLQRLPDIVAFKPDVLFVGGFHNDVDKSVYSSVARKAAIVTYLQAVIAALPDCFIVVVGTQLLQNDQMTTGGNLSFFDLEIDVRDAVLQVNDSKVLFIPLLTRPKNVLTNANGNFYLVTTAPYNDAHPTPRYAPFITGYVADKFKKWISSLKF
jgi:hypothetical protein